MDDQEYTDEEVTEHVEALKAMVELIEKETGELGEGYDEETAQRFYLTSQGIRRGDLLAMLGWTGHMKLHEMQRATQEIMSAGEPTPEAVQQLAELVSNIDEYGTIMAFLVGHRLGRQIISDV